MSELFSPSELLNVAKLQKWSILDVLLSGVSLFRFDIDIKDEEDNALIHILVKKRPNLLDKALTKGANFDAVNREGETALHLAAENGNQRAVALLLDVGADQSIRDFKGETAIFKAAANGYYEIVRCLIDRSGVYNPITSLNDEGCNLLHVSTEHPNILKHLLTLGASVNHINNNKLTPLHVAVTKGCYDSTNLLITGGANIDCYYDSGRRQSLLQNAVEQKHEKIATKLIEMGIDINYRNSQGETALHAAVKTKSTGALEALLNSGVCVNLTDEDGYAPLHLVAETQEVKFAQRLLSKGALINQQTSNGDSVLHRAASLGNFSVVESLLNCEGGVDVNLLNNDGCTAMHLAADNGHDLIVDYLVKHGADVSLLDKFQRTFLILCPRIKPALKSGNPGVIKNSQKIKKKVTFV